MKRKVIVVIVCIILILLAMNLLSKADLRAEVNPSINEIKGGESVTITLAFEDYNQINKGLNAYKATLEYDHNIFDEVNNEDFVCINNWESLKYNKNNGQFVAIKKAGSTAPESVVHITLKAKENVKAGTTDIKVKDIVTSEGEKDIVLSEAKLTINIIEEQDTKPDDTKKPEKITSDKYIIEENYITRVLPRTTVQEFKQNVKLENVITEPQMVFTDKDGIALNDDEFITTDTKLKVGSTLNYTLVVIGDTDKDAQLTINDLAELKLHIIESKLLNGISLRAADIDNDGQITINDLAQMKLILIDLLELK